MQMGRVNMPVACSVPDYAPERVRSARVSEQNPRRTPCVQPAWSPSCAARILRSVRSSRVRVALIVDQRNPNT